ncbi:MAG: hypothetical protein ACLQL2_13460 [Methylovirgula sp.]
MGGSIVKRLTMAVLFAAIAATPALAAKYILVKDTVGNCSAVASSPRGYAGMTVVSKKKYPSIEAANKALDGVKGCSGLVR